MNGGSVVLDQYNLFYLGRVANPYVVYHQLRSEDPVHWSEPLGTWILTRYDDVRRTLNDPRLSSARSDSFMSQLPETVQAEMHPLSHQLSLWLIHKDPPDHTRLRSLVHKAFTPRVVENLRRHIQEIVDGLLDVIEAGRRMDLIRDFAYPLPAIVIAEMIGVPREKRDQFRRWSSDISMFVGAGRALPERARRAQSGLLELMDYLRELIAQHRHEPKDDLMNALIAAEEQGDALSEEELVALCVLLLNAGHETTSNLIGNGLLALLQHPDQLQRLRDDPTLIVSAVEELLRYDTPIQRVGRIPKEDIEIGGKRIRQDQFISAMLGAANRDPAHFPDPDRLDLARENNRHISFGHGIHFCIGAPLARLEAQIAINTVLRRLPALRLDTTVLEWHDNFAHRFLKSLPVVF